MKFGIFHLMESPRDKDYVELEKELAEQTAYAEELGFDAAWLAEHHFDRDYGLCPSTMMYAVRLAQATNRIRIGSLVVVLPLNHPLRVASEAAFADVLTGGRLILGLGSGYAPYEFAGYDVDLDSRRERFKEGLEIVKRALAGETFSHSGRFYNFPELTCYPRPLQQPLPIWMTANSADTSIFVGQEGAPLVLSGNSLPLDVLRENFKAYRQAWHEAGHPGEPHCALNRMVCVAESDSQARADAEDGTMGYLKRQAAVFNEGKRLDPEGFVYDKFVGNMFTHGSPDTCAENIGLLERELGLDYMVCKFYVKGLSHRQVMASMRRFASEVMPRFTAGRVPAGVAAS
jgi:alkanesulfonate monooxygenase SsuD/methylene tetrahydromethanopterin reductase-like flavin-dependent oxidoreductase (luciferase family)